MHRLDRGSVPVPPCLAQPLPGRRYRDLDKAEKGEVRSALLQIHAQRCAYCERRTGDGANDGHVEHFRNQAGHHHLELDWNNLFWSCNDETTCGKHKDKCDRPAGPQAKFETHEILDPCVDEPERFLLFVVDGTVRPRDGITPEERRRAEETLRVFRLSESPLLRKSRADAVKPYIEILDFLRSAGPDLLVQYVRGELNKQSAAAFPTAVKHFLESIVLP